MTKKIIPMCALKSAQTPCDSASVACIENFEGYTEYNYAVICTIHKLSVSLSIHSIHFCCPLPQRLHKTHYFYWNQPFQTKKCMYARTMHIWLQPSYSQTLLTHMENICKALQNLLIHFIIYYLPHAPVRLSSTFHAPSNLVALHMFLKKHIFRSPQKFPLYTQCSVKLT